MRQTVSLEVTLIGLALSAAAPAGAAPTVVMHDLGGDVRIYARAVAYAPGPFAIEGVCGSACTMLLGRRDTCVSPSAELLFHQAFWNEDVSNRSELGTRILWSHYPPGVRARLAALGGLSAVPIAMSGADAIAAGVPPCP